MKLTMHAESAVHNASQQTPNRDIKGILSPCQRNEGREFGSKVVSVCNPFAQHRHGKVCRLLCMCICIVTDHMIRPSVGLYIRTH